MLYIELSAKCYEPLTREEETHLAACILKYKTTDKKKYTACVHELILRHTRLAYKIARQYTKLDTDEAFNVALLALTEAMNRWMPSPGAMNSYQWAKRYITTSLNKATDASRQIRLPEQIAYKAALNTRAIALAEYELRRKLTIAEIHALTSGPSLQDLPKVSASLSQPTGEDDTTCIGDTIPDTGVEVENAIIKREMLDIMNNSLNVLNAKERIVIESRFGLGDKPRLTLSELGKKLNASGEAIRRIEATAMAKLQHPANNQGVLYETD